VRISESLGCTLTLRAFHSARGKEAKREDFMKRFLLLLTLMAVNTGGCKSQVHHESPETVGERTNHQGVVTQRIIRETSYTEETIPASTPDGPKKRRHVEVKYFLQEQGKPRREFSIMQSADFSNYEKYWPLENTVSWVATGIDPVGNKDKLYFMLFDASRIIRTNIFSVVPRWKSEESEYELRDGNRTLILRTPHGLEKYDVLADTTSKVEK